jgi:hypothetical protein
MSESAAHQSLVRSLVAWVTQTRGAGSIGCVYIDCPESNSYSKPPTIGGFIPDLYYEPPGEIQPIIGEAKTAKDLESRHTLSQFAAFLLHCENCGSGVLVVAVPWHLTRLARSILRELIQRKGWHKAKILVLEQLEG